MVLIHGYYFLHSRTCGKQKWNLFYLGSSKYSISNLIIPRLKMYHMSRDFIAIFGLPIWRQTNLFPQTETRTFCNNRFQSIIWQPRDCIKKQLSGFNSSFSRIEAILGSLPNGAQVVSGIIFHPKTVFVKIHVGNHSFIMCNFLPDD